jgi:anhydro-N-acetylmuramic acid kinase
MANLGYLSAERVLAFDTGPAGSLLDGLARRLLGRPFDAGGAVAARGRPDPARVEAWLAHPFLGAAPPKSTGRDTFGAAWVDGLGLAGATAEDALATAVEFVARAVALGWRHLPGTPAALAVAGGGLHNALLMRRLAALLPVAPRPAADFGVPGDAREALVFAVLAMRAVLGHPVTRPDATGAAPGRVLGKLSPGPP